MWNCKQCNTEIVMKRKFYDLTPIEKDGTISNRRTKGDYCNGHSYVCNNCNQEVNSSSDLKLIAVWEE